MVAGSEATGVDLELGGVTFALVAAILWGLGPVVTNKGFEWGDTPAQAAMVVTLMSWVLFWATLLPTAGHRAFARFEWIDPDTSLPEGTPGLSRTGTLRGVIAAP